MPPQYTRADSLREYLSGAGSDGGAQTAPDQSLGGFRSSTEALTYGLLLGTPGLTDVTVLVAGGGNPVGQGTLRAVDADNLTWQPYGAATPGLPAPFSGTDDIEVVEANGLPGQYLRVKGTPPFSVGAMAVTLSYLVNDFYGGPNVTVADATAGQTLYRATIIRNESVGIIDSLRRWLNSRGPTQPADVAQLPGSGSGTITTSGSLALWPATGWCHVMTGSTIREVIYYTSRTTTALTVPTAGRGLLGTTATAGSALDTIIPVPGVAIGMDPTGVVASGSSVQTVASPMTAPVGVTWLLGTTQAAGLNLGTLGPDQQVGVWMKRQIPAGAVSSPLHLIDFVDSFNSF